MKKLLAMIMTSIIFVTSLTCVSVSCQEFETRLGFVVEFNGETIDSASVIINNTHYVPLRKVFEKMGAYVFYRNRDCQVLALSRDGDTIRHIVGSNIIIVNGEQKEFENPSVLENGGTYIPIEMVSAALNPDRILYDNQQLNIQKYLFNNNYHKIIKDVLDVCGSSNFYPERFQRYIDYHVKMPDYSMQEVIFRVNLGLDYSFYENATTIEQPYDLLVLVNKYFKLPEGYEQYNLVKMGREYTVNDGKQYLLAGVAYEKYIEMSDAAKKDGLSMKVLSAYRTENYQRNLYNNKVRTTGKVNADNYSARPGHSEHQTGLAVDISSTKGTFEYTPEFKWLQKHAHEYGYILRYPKGKEWITGYSYEPWHYRYVGVDAAKIIYEEGITYEEYYAKYISQNEFR
ncbi:MAG: D-alanyl-D-alanine carboxypeptidase family protein [Clostridia bacterium]|nr:D-alanyl-D-alanine carboxypeptidase family protein [Clostridia bacterium]